MLAFIILSYLRILFLIWPYLSICLTSEYYIDNRNLFGNFENISRKSTNVSEKSQGIEDFVSQNTSNIIIENKQEYIINSNIQNMEKNNIKHKNISISNVKDNSKSQTIITIN